MKVDQKIDEDMFVMEKLVSLCQEKDILPEIIYLAFSVKEKHPRKDGIDCMSEVLWEWLAKSERVTEITPEKIQELLDKNAEKL